MNDIVEVEVRETLRTGVLVNILATNRLGLIRQRELTWDRRVDASYPAFAQGERLRAKVISDTSQDKYARLSLARLTNPWEGASERYRKGQIVRGEVVSVRRYGAFVQLEPGIDAIIRPEGVPKLRSTHLDSILSVGDQVQGVLTEFDVPGSVVEMSIVEWLQKITNMNAGQRQLAQGELFGPALARQTANAQPHDAQGDSGVMNRRWHAPIRSLERILVVEDNRSDLSAICRSLEEEFKIPVDGCQSGNEAREKVALNPTYDIAVIDLNLAAENGIDVAHDLVEYLPDLSFVFTSVDPAAEHGLPAINGRTYPFAPKESGAIVAGIEALRSGDWEETRNAGVYTGHGDFVEQLGMLAFVQRNPVDILNAMATKLHNETGVSQVLVVEVDLVKKTASLLAADPPLDPDKEEAALDGLYYSPIRNIIEDEENFYDGQIARHRSAKYKNFFRSLRYAACYGVPIKITDIVTHHALVLLDDTRPNLDDSIFEPARLAAQFMAVALERGFMLDFMRRYELRYTHGQLLGSFVHELRNKLSGLGDNVGSMPGLLRQMAQAKETGRFEGFVGEVQHTVDDIVAIHTELQELTNAYSKLVTGEMEPVDVNALAEKVKVQMKMAAGEAVAEIRIEHDPDLPPARAIASRLEQILTNLVLNAVQQIRQQRETMRRIAGETKRPPLLSRSGLVVIRTQLNPHAVLPSIRVLVMDTGPGIHYPKRRELFVLDKTTRERGQGLGLYISRSMARAMGGQLWLADSVVYLGSVFVVELPVFR